MYRRFPPWLRFVPIAILLATNACSTGSGGFGGTTKPTPSPLAEPTARVDEGMSGSVRFGAGWGPIETYNGATFRWASNDAQLIACPDSKHHVLKVELEPGPSLGSKEMKLAVRSSANASQLIRIRDRRTVQIDVGRLVPVSVVTLHAESKNLPVPREKRRLNFREFSATLGVAGNCGIDIVPDGESFRLAQGWYPLETFNGETFRWAKDAASFVMVRNMANLTLELEVGLGPSLGNKPLSLQLRKGSRKSPIATARAVAHSYVTLHVGAVRTGDTFVLHAQNQGKPVLGDPRVLNFRVLQAFATQSNI